jgi:type IV secretory pathway ATPase VirB11/archaellum biosynthesis ATPase
MALPRFTPFHWWGPPWVQRAPRTLEELVALESLGSTEAGFLGAHVAAGGSVVVCALPQGAGKSTLAQALVDEVSPDRTRIYIRGSNEPFDWQERYPPDTTTLLVNEISDHLPVYCWAECARRVLELAAMGYQIIATAHAAAPEQVASLLMEPPISASAAQVVALDVVVFLDIAPTSSGMERVVRSIVRWEIDLATGMPIARPVAL